MDLSDGEIDRMLSEAQRRLATNASEKNVARVRQPAEISTASETSASTLSKEQPKKDLSVRVPPLAAKKDKTAKDTAGAEWYDLPRTRMTPELRRDLQLLKMRSVLNPGQFFKKDTRKDPVPEFSVTGRIVEGPTDYYSGRLNRRERKRTLVEEVLTSDDVIAKFKSRYDQIQERKTSGKKGHYKKMMAMRRRRG